MQKGMGGGLGTLLVLGLGMGLLRTGSPAGGPAPSPKPADQQSVEALFRSVAAASKSLKPCAEKDLLDTIDDFLPPPTDSDVCDSKRLDEEFDRLGKSYEINFAIAIVPDPAHTYLSLFFDRTMDAIQQGAQQAGWIFDRATTPWDSQEHPESTDFRIRLQQDDYQGNKEDLPGLMIFRPAYPDQDRQQKKSSLFVFVVGERPTGGISKKQFKRAIELMDKARGSKAKDLLRIIGPTFSGSLYSLSHLIDDQLPKEQFNGIVIRSGSVSSWETARWFKRQFECTPQVDFATFQESDRYLVRSFIEFENRRGYAPGRIAVLTEDETAYGHLEFGPTQDSKKPCAEQPRAEASSKTPNEQERTLQGYEDAVLRLYYPRDISQLRGAYQQGFQQQSSSSTDSYQVRSTLPTNLQDTGSDDDSVPQYAHSQTPLSQESILLGIVAAIRLHDIQFVVLQATNPMDAVFLSAFLKKSDSAARVVAMPADLLLSRDADDVSLLHGVMALTTYSLLPVLADEVAIPNSVDNPRLNHIFPNAYAAGTYNAALSQIACIKSPSDKSSPAPGCRVPSVGLPEAHYAEYGWPSLGGAPKPTTEPLAPVVWLTVLGRGGFWPVAILADGGHKEGNIEPSPRPIYIVARPCAEQYPGHPECCTRMARKFKPSQRTFSGLASGFVFMLVAAYLWLLWNGSILASTSAVTVLAPIKDRCRSGLILLIGWLLLSALLLLLWPWADWAGLGFLPTAWVIIDSIAVLLLCTVGARGLNRRGDTHEGLAFILVAAVLFAFFLVLYGAGHAQNSFLYRYVYITSGVSPLLPLLCLLAAGGWWGWFSLSGLALVDKRRPNLPCNRDLPNPDSSRHIGPRVMAPFWPTEEFVKKLSDVMRPCSWDPRIYIPIIALFGISLCVLNYAHPLLTLETRHFEWIYAISLAAVMFALLGTLFRLYVTWLECRRVLTTLDRFPLRRAFGELNFTLEPFWRMGGGQGADSSRLVSRQLETLEQLSREAATISVKADSGDDRMKAKDLADDIGNTTGAINEMRQKFADFFGARAAVAQMRSSTRREQSSFFETQQEKHDAPREPECSNFFIDNYERVQERIAHTCGAVLGYLQFRWRGKEGLIVHEAGSAGDDKNVTVVCCKDDQDESEPSLCTRLAERFVAMVYLNFIVSVMLRMRTLTVAVAGLYVFLLLSVNSYPFEPRAALRSEAILLLVFIVGVVGFVSAQIHRDPILSLVTQTKPVELGVAFWLRMGTFVALPLISLLVSQFPTLNNALFSWLEPAVSALK